MDPCPSPSRSRSYSLKPALYLFLLLYPSISVSFFGNCSSSSYSLFLSCRSRFSPSFSLSHPRGSPRSTRIPTVVGSSLYNCLFLPARAMPCSDCLTATLHVRTTERPPRSLHRQRTRSTISIFLSHSSPRNRAFEVHPLPRTFRISPTFAAHVPPQPPFAS